MPSWLPEGTKTKGLKMGQLLNNTDRLIVVQRRSKPKSSWKIVARFATVAEAEVTKERYAADERREVEQIKNGEKKPDKKKKPQPSETAEYRVYYDTITRVYRYGLRSPDVERDVDQQMFQGHVYRNSLVAIYKASREEYRALLNTVGDVDAAGQHKREKAAIVEQLKQQIKTVRKRSRARAEPPELKARLKAAKAELTLATNSYKVLVAKADEAGLYTKGKKAIDATKGRAIKEARRVARTEQDLFWGTYGRREEFAARANKGHYDPKFHRWDYGDGSTWLAVQLQKGLSLSDLFSAKNRYLQIAPIDLLPDENDPRVWNKSVRKGERRRRSRTLVRVCIGSTSGKPVYATFPLELHRPLPANSKVKWAVVIRERVGRGQDCDKWSLHLSMEIPKKPVVRRPGVVGVNLGWRLKQSRKAGGVSILRVAYWADDQGNHGEVLLDDAIWHRDNKAKEGGYLGHARHLRSIRDKAFNAARDDLGSWLRGRRKRRQYIPKWLRTGAKNLGNWRSARRLAKLVWKWKDNRFADDVEIYRRLEGWRSIGADGKPFYEGWRKQDKHLHNWEAHSARRGRNKRKNTCQHFAKRLATLYGTVVVTQMDYAKAARRAGPGEEKESHDAARRQRQVAAPSRLRDAIQNACSTHGSDFNALPVRTDWCHVCGTPNLWASEKSKIEDIKHTCKGCGNVIDQDHNAAEIVWRIWTDNFNKKAA